MGFDGFNLALGVGFLLTFDGNNLFGCSVDELLIGEFLHHAGEEAFGIFNNEVPTETFQMRNYPD